MPLYAPVTKARGRAVVAIRKLLLCERVFAGRRASKHCTQLRLRSFRAQKLLRRVRLSSTRKRAMPRQVSSLTLADARQLIAAGEQKARELGIPYNLAVVDAGGELVAHVRMDGAWMGSINIAVNKAWTSRAFDMATHELAKMAQSGKPL